MRDYDIVYDQLTDSYFLIFKDPGDESWTVQDREMTRETAKMAVKGYMS